MASSTAFMARNKRRRKTKNTLQARALAAFAVALVLIARPQLAELILTGAAVVLGVALVAAVVYGAGLALHRWQPPARVILGRFCVEFM